MRHFLYIVGLLIFSISLSFGTVKVCVTTSFIRDLVESIGGEKVEVVSLMGAGVDPHLYKASLGDLKKLRSAEVIFYNGLHLEGRMTEVFKSMKGQGIETHEVTEDIPVERLIGVNGDGTLYDPHVWFDPNLWAMCAEKVAKVLKKRDPKDGEYYEKRFKDYEGKLKKLDEWAKKEIEGIVEEKRVLVTSHDAYNYFGKAYKFKVVGVQGVSTASEAGLADIASIVDFIKKRGVKAIFVETSVSPGAIERISRDAKVSIGGELYSDSLGGCEETNTYEKVFRHNVGMITKYLR